MQNRIEANSLRTGEPGYAVASTNKTLAAEPHSAAAPAEVVSIPSVVTITGPHMALQELAATVTAAAKYATSPGVERAPAEGARGLARRTRRRPDNTAVGGRGIAQDTG